MFEDSLNSTKAALEEGIVPGGGKALLQASKAIHSLKLEGEEALGANIVAIACELPFKQIVTEYGRDGSIVLGNEVKNAPATYGFNALNEQVEDLLQAGVVDALKVVKHASA